MQDLKKIYNVHALHNHTVYVLTLWKWLLYSITCSIGVDWKFANAVHISSSLESEISG